MTKSFLSVCLILLTTLLCGQEVLRKTMISSGEVELAVRLVMPDQLTDSPPPVIIVIHGSGKNADYVTYKKLVDRLANEGFAVAFYDKRGIGESTGEYMDVNVKIGTQAFAKLSDDAIAVANWVVEQPEIDPTRIGAFGLSQGGWITPLAANKSNHFKFAVIISGPVCSMGHEKYFSKLAGDEKKKSKYGLNEINALVAAFDGKLGFDSYGTIEQMSIPTLWMFGEKDASMPVALSQENLRTIIDKKNKTQFSVRIYPNANHSLIDINTKEQLNYISDARAWIIDAIY